MVSGRQIHRQRKNGGCKQLKGHWELQRMCSSSVGRQKEMQQSWAQWLHASMNLLHATELYPKRQSALKLELHINPNVHKHFISHLSQKQNKL